MDVQPLSASLCDSLHETVLGRDEPKAHFLTFAHACAVALLEQGYSTSIFSICCPGIKGLHEKQFSVHDTAVASCDVVFSHAFSVDGAHNALFELHLLDRGDVAGKADIEHWFQQVAKIYEFGLCFRAKHIQLERAISRADALVQIDEASGLPNRRHFETRFEELLSRAQRYAECLTVLQVNIALCPDVEETARVSFLAELVGDTRQTDYLARIAPQQLFIVLMDTEESDAAIAYLNRLAQLNAVYSDRLRVAVGGVDYPMDGLKTTALMKKLEVALQQAIDERSDSAVCFYRGLMAISD